MKSRFGKILHVLFRTNLVQTLRFNWKMLPARQAWHLPFHFYGKVEFRSLKGRVILDGPAKCGMILVGVKDCYVDTHVPLTIWTINGTVRFRGKALFLRGSYLLVAKSGTLTIGTHRTAFAAGLRLFCFDSITIGDCARIAWECQIMDTSFHYLEHIDTGEVPPLTKPVVIGDRVWIGNRSTISKGAVIPSDTIVASGSLVNRDFSSLEPYCLLAGVPAAKKATGIRRVLDMDRERALDEQYHYDRTHL